MNSKWFAVCIMATMVGCGSSSTLAPAFEPPPLPGEVVTSGITFRAAVKVVKSDPTTVRVTVEASNETDVHQEASIAGGPGCMVLLRAYWPENPEGQQLAPDPEIACFGVAIGVALEPGEVRTLPVAHEVAPSTVLGAAFVPGVYVFGAVITDASPLEMRAGLARIDR